MNLRLEEEICGWTVILGLDPFHPKIQGDVGAEDAAPHLWAAIMQTPAPLCSSSAIAFTAAVSASDEVYEPHFPLPSEHGIS